MARKFHREDIRQMLHEGIQRLVAREGIESLTTRKITSECGLSDPYLYQCYDGIRELVEAAFLEVDKELGLLLNATVSQVRFSSFDKDLFEANCKALWLSYWNFLMEKADRTVFYWRFCQSAYLTGKINQKRAEHHGEWHAVINEAVKRHGLDRHADVCLLLSSIVDGTLMSAVKLLGREDAHKDYDKSTETVFRTVFAQIFAIFERERQNIANAQSGE